jgi:hypothetical protein
VFDRILDACFALPATIEAEYVAMPGPRCQEVEIRLADRISGRSQVLRIDPIADADEIATRLDEGVAMLIGRSAVRGPATSNRYRT